MPSPANQLWLGLFTSTTNGLGPWRNRVPVSASGRRPSTTGLKAVVSGAGAKLPDR